MQKRLAIGQGVTILDQKNRGLIISDDNLVSCEGGRLFCPKLHLTHN